MSTVYINGRFATQPLSGVQRYAREIVAQLDEVAAQVDPAVRYVLLTPRGADDLGLDTIKQEACGKRHGHAWDQIDFAAAARGGVALSLCSTGPVVHRRQIVVIHDAAVQRHPEHFSRGYRTAHAVLDLLLARTANLATVSEFSRRELSELLRVPARSILVAPNGWQHMQVQPDSQATTRLGLVGKPYFLALGNLTPNKNLAVILRALARLQGSEARLVAVGRIDPSVFGSGGVPQAGPDLLLPGRLSDAEVAGLMQSARALIFPSIYEGFGIPPIEAFVNKCPVLASTAEAVVEVCQDAAEYFDPHDDARLAELMRMVLADDGSWRAAKLARAQERLAHYSWRRSAEILAQACARLARGQPAA